jgi:hypothetical protein
VIHDSTCVGHLQVILHVALQYCYCTVLFLILAAVILLFLLGVYVPGYCYFELFLGLSHLLLGDVAWRHHVPIYSIIHTFHACYTPSPPHGLDYKALNNVSNYVLTFPNPVNVTCTALRYNKHPFQTEENYFNCCPSVHVDNHTIITPTKCTLLLLKSQDITICNFVLYFTPTCFNPRGSSSGGSMPVPG